MHADITAELAAIGVRPLEDAHLVWFTAELERCTIPPRGG